MVAAEAGEGKGGVIMEDHVLWWRLVADDSRGNPYRKGKVNGGNAVNGYGGVDGDYERKDETEKLREFNEIMHQNERLYIFMMPLWDGVGLAPQKAPQKTLGQPRSLKHTGDQVDDSWYKPALGQCIPGFSYPIQSVGNEECYIQRHPITGNFIQVVCIQECSSRVAWVSLYSSPARFGPYAFSLSRDDLSLDDSTGSSAYAGMPIRGLNPSNPAAMPAIQGISAAMESSLTSLRPSLAESRTSNQAHTGPTSGCPTTPHCQRRSDFPQHHRQYPPVTAAVHSSTSFVQASSRRRLYTCHRWNVLPHLMRPRWGLGTVPGRRGPQQRDPQLVAGKRR
ncbi:uncharacterized protein BCR38DRAFT_498334 [Pseudomassariella vexata]|uniref:Uncharacterized protein n=1 Tax=Pseudomassariella vexata TaxID=1141098 RepID=A0A1Y2DK73_9PEZI|nr:uncharacterized protein BCR38DRAFT_498334 [Pseudomassariella vexata]ORY59579.1 hypothetical protein BCR38DRAFT_498334 [Pseudomassariella vexata]